MADTAAPAAKKVVKKTTKPKAPAAHPTYSAMIVAAIKSLKERNGSSRQAVLKYIMANYKLGNDTKAVGVHLRMALKRGVASGILKNSKGAGASGSFRVTEKADKPKKVKKPKTPKAKKPKAKKPKAAKKPGTPKAKKPKAKSAAKPKKSPAKKAAKPKKPAAPKPKVAKATKPKAAAKPKAAKPKKTAAKKKAAPKK